MVLIAADLAAMLGLLISWGLVGLGAGKLRTAEQGQLRAAARGLLVRIAIGSLFVAAKAVTFALLASAGWLFVKDTIIVHSVLIALPALGTLAWSAPRLLRAARKRGDRTEFAGTRKGETAAAAIWPMQMAAGGCALDFIITLFYPDQAVQPMNLLLILLIDAGFAAAALQWNKRRNAALSRTSDSSNMAGTDWRSRGSRSFLKHRLSRMLAAAAMLLVIISGWFVLSAQASHLPARMSMMSGIMDDGKGNGGMMRDSSGHDMMMGNETAAPVSVADLTGPQTGEPDKRFTLIAEKTTIHIGDDPAVEAWTFNAQSPGPELRVTQGDLVEVTLINKDIDDGVTLHWHGLDVPNAEDGVAGVTQDSVQPGETYTYRFRAEQTGTFWYHSHQQSLEEVEKGLFGPLIVEPSEKPNELDITAMLHSWTAEDGQSVSQFDKLDSRQVAPGTPVRFRLVNTGDWPDNLYVSGTPFRVAAIDGTDLNGPTELTDQALELAAGGRYDVTFTMPDHPVLLSNGLPDGGILLSPDGNGTPPTIVKGPKFDPLNYGQPKETPFDSTSAFDRSFTMVFDNKLGFYDGSFERLFTINGEVFPNTPMLMVKEGDLVKTTFVNRSLVPHPMHLHGHHMLVLSRNGKPTTGSPWWTDTLNVNPGETYEVAFVADNPGVWMDHCHNLEHAAIGMTLHLAYEGVTSPYEIGHATQNRPE